MKRIFWGFIILLAVLLIFGLFLWNNKDNFNFIREGDRLYLGDMPQEQLGEYPNLEEANFRELSMAPNCTEYGLAKGPVIINTRENYQDSILNIIQGGYVNFQGDGLKKTFEFPYQALDTGMDGKVGAEDFAIYLNQNGREMPLFFENGEIIVFEGYPEGHEVRRIPISDVVSFDESANTFTFVEAPVGKISISAGRSYRDPPWTVENCLEDFDLDVQTILGTSYIGNGCFEGYERRIFKDDAKKEIVYAYKLKSSGNRMCVSLGKSFQDWVVFDNLKDYKIVFAQVN